MTGTEKPPGFPSSLRSSSPGSPLGPMVSLRRAALSGGAWRGLLPPSVLSLAGARDRSCTHLPVRWSGPELFFQDADVEGAQSPVKRRSQPFPELRRIHSPWSSRNWASG